MLLQVKEVTHAYRENRTFWSSSRQAPVLSNVSLALEEGQCLGLLGTSGAGKSTLGKVILGMEKPQTGQVLFQDHDFYKVHGSAKRALRRDLQAVFQDSYSAVNPRSTAEQIIGEPLENYERLSRREQKAKVGELLETVGLKAEDMAKYPNQFSGGQLQRIAIARAIALKPKLIVLDESVSSLDMVNQTYILDLLNKLKKDFGLSYLFITHDIKAAYTLCDKLAVMERGEIVDSFQEKDHIFNSTHLAVKKLLSAMLPEHPRYRTRLRRDESQS